MKRPIPFSMAEEVQKTKAAKIGPRAVNSNRASMLGISCDRRIVYERTRWQDKKLHDAALQSIFDLGTFLEDLVIDDLKAAGFRIIQQQRDLAMPEYEVTGHIDAAIEIDSQIVPIDAKTMSPHVWAKVDEPEDFFEHKYEHVRGYPTQVILYAHMLKANWACLYCINKVTGEGKDIWFHLPDYPDVVPVAIERAANVTKHVRAGTLPDRITDLSLCMKCPFAHICYPDKDFGPGVVLMDDHDLEAKLERWWATRDAANEHDEIDEDVKKRIGASGVESAELGPFLIAVSNRHRKTWVIDENMKKMIGHVVKKPYKVVSITKKEAEPEIS